MTTAAGVGAGAGAADSQCVDDGMMNESCPVGRGGAVVFAEPHTCRKTPKRSLGLIDANETGEWEEPDRGHQGTHGGRGVRAGQNPSSIPFQGRRPSTPYLSRFVGACVVQCQISHLAVAHGKGIPSPSPLPLSPTLFGVPLHQVPSQLNKAPTHLPSPVSALDAAAGRTGKKHSKGIIRS